MSETLDEIAARFSSLDGFNAKMSDYAFESMKPFFTGRRCLELGCSDGKMTPRLLDCFDEVVAVDGSEVQISRLEHSIRSDRLSTAVLMLEDSDGIKALGNFDTVVMSYILEHVDDPVRCLTNAASVLVNGGRVLIVVPNGRSLHRQIGKQMGILKDLTDFSPADCHAGHQRTYVKDTLRNDIALAGMTCTFISGVFLKILDAGQLENMNEAFLRALFELGPVYPDLCSSIMAIATK